jgi:hypothetical protein
MGGSEQRIEPSVCDLKDDAGHSILNLAGVRVLQPPCWRAVAAIKALLDATHRPQIAGHVGLAGGLVHAPL